MKLLSAYAWVSVCNFLTRVVQIKTNYFWRQAQHIGLLCISNCRCQSPARSFNHFQTSSHLFINSSLGSLATEKRCLKRAIGSGGDLGIKGGRCVGRYVIRTPDMMNFCFFSCTYLYIFLYASLPEFYLFLDCFAEHCSFTFARVVYWNTPPRATKFDFFWPF